MHSRGPYGQNMHFFASRFMAWILLWHDNMICLKPKSLSKNCFRHTSHVLCTCAFLIWIFNKSNNYRAIVLILSHLKEPNIPYFVWKNQPKRTKAAKVMAIQSFDDARVTIVLTLNGLIWEDFARGPQNQKIQKF